MPSFRLKRSRFLAANAPHTYVAVTPGNGIAFQYRTTTGGSSSSGNTTGLGAPDWVRLVRTGNTFTGYRSPNGVNWTQQGTTTIAMGTTVYVGLALTSHNNSLAFAASFDNVSVPNWPPAPQLSIRAAATNVTLTWPLASTGYSLQSRTNLSQGTWDNITSPSPQILDGQWRVTLPVDTNHPSVFYRLSK